MDRQDPFSLWIWRRFRIEAPGDWEVLQYNRHPDKGRFAFADRYRFRLEFNWQSVGGAPDFDHMMRDYRANLEAGGHNPVEDLSHGAWRGLLAEKDSLITSRFGRYFEGNGCLVELVFPWPAGRDAALEQRILAGFAPQEDEPDGSHRWRAFGLDARVPSGCALDDCLVQPALARMEFSGARRQGRWRFQRLGLLKHWLRQPPAEWLLARTEGARGVQQDARDVAGHRVDLVRGALKSRGWLRPTERLAAAAWTCPGDGRLYHVEQVAARGAPEEAGALLRRLACCESFRRRA